METGSSTTLGCYCRRQEVKWFNDGETKVRTSDVCLLDTEWTDINHQEKERRAQNIQFRSRNTSLFCILMLRRWEELEHVLMKAGLSAYENRAAEWRMGGDVWSNISFPLRAGKRAILHAHTAEHLQCNWLLMYEEEHAVFYHHKTQQQQRLTGKTDCKYRFLRSAHWSEIKKNNLTTDTWHRALGLFLTCLFQGILTVNKNISIKTTFTSPKLTFS